MTDMIMSTDDIGPKVNPCPVQCGGSSEPLAVFLWQNLSHLSASNDIERALFPSCFSFGSLWGQQRG